MTLQCIKGTGVSISVSKDSGSTCPEWVVVRLTSSHSLSPFCGAARGP